MRSTTGAGWVLSGLPHPRRMVDLKAENAISFRSASWSQAMLRLYRRLYKVHGQFLSVEQRMLGDRFVRTEFRRHVQVSPRDAGLFYKGWCDYLRQLEAGAALQQRRGLGLSGSARAAGATGRDMTPDELAMLSDEQRERLVNLRRHALELRLENGDFKQ